MGRVVSFHHDRISFDAQVPHCVMPWQGGSRVVLVVFTVRNHDRIAAQDVTDLRRLGFRMPARGDLVASGCDSVRVDVRKELPSPAGCPSPRPCCSHMPRFCPRHLATQRPVPGLTLRVLGPCRPLAWTTAPLGLCVRRLFQATLHSWNFSVAQPALRPKCDSWRFRFWGLIINRLLSMRAPVINLDLRNACGQKSRGALNLDGASLWHIFCGGPLGFITWRATLRHAGTNFIRVCMDLQGENVLGSYPWCVFQASCERVMVHILTRLGAEPERRMAGSLPLPRRRPILLAFARLLPVTDTATSATNAQKQPRRGWALSGCPSHVFRLKLHWGILPRTSQACRRGPSCSGLAFFLIGELRCARPSVVCHTPQEFLHAAMKVTHPFDSAVLTGQT